MRAAAVADDRSGSPTVSSEASPLHERGGLTAPAPRPPWCSSASTALPRRARPHLAADPPGRLRDPCARPDCAPRSPVRGAAALASLPSAPRPTSRRIVVAALAARVRRPDRPPLQRGQRRRGRHHRRRDGRQLALRVRTRGHGGPTDHAGGPRRLWPLPDVLWLAGRVMGPRHEQVLARLKETHEQTDHPVGSPAQLYSAGTPAVLGRNVINDPAEYRRLPLDSLEAGAQVSRTLAQLRGRRRRKDRR